MSATLTGNALLVPCAAPGASHWIARGAYDLDVNYVYQLTPEGAEYRAAAPTTQLRIQD